MKWKTLHVTAKRTDFQAEINCFYKQCWGLKCHFSFTIFVVAGPWFNKHHPFKTNTSKEQAPKYRKENEFISSVEPELINSLPKLIKCYLKAQSYTLKKLKSRVNSSLKVC